MLGISPRIAMLIVLSSLILNRQSYAQNALSVDMDISQPGIQSVRPAALGDTFTVALVLKIDAGGVSSYGFSARIDPTELELDGVTPWSIPSLPAGLSRLAPALFPSLAIPPANGVDTFEAATLGVGPASTEFEIGRITLRVPGNARLVDDGLPDVLADTYNSGIDGLFDNAGVSVTFLKNPGYVVPWLTVRCQGGNVTVTWVADPDRVLEESGDLNPGSIWLPSAVVNGVPFSPPAGVQQRFFRLRSISTGTTLSCAGYCKLVASAGFTMIGNPFRSSRNSLDGQLGDVPSGSLYFQYDPALRRFDMSMFTSPSWFPDLPLEPGNGGFLFLVSPAEICFSGELLRGVNSIPLPRADLAVLSTPVPVSGTVTQLGLPIGSGDTIYEFDGTGYTVNTFDLFGDGMWDPGPEPEFKCGRSLWLFRQAPSAASWAFSLLH